MSAASCAPRRMVPCQVCKREKRLEYCRGVMHPKLKRKVYVCDRCEPEWAEKYGT